MADKNVPKNPTPKGADYCNKQGTSCTYDHLEICINCSRPKGWRRTRKAE